jgi:hypothetical protein
MVAPAPSRLDAKDMQHAATAKTVRHRARVCWALALESCIIIHKTMHVCCFLQWGVLVNDTSGSGGGRTATLSLHQLLSGGKTSMAAEYSLPLNGKPSASTNPGYSLLAPPRSSRRCAPPASG